MENVFTLIAAQDSARGSVSAFCQVGGCQVQNISMTGRMSETIAKVMNNLIRSGQYTDSYLYILITKIL